MKRTQLRIAGGIRHLSIENGVDDGNLSISIGYNSDVENGTLFFDITMGEAEDVVKFLEGKIREYQSQKR